jgi:hypothetical protein
VVSVTDAYAGNLKTTISSTDVEAYISTITFFGKGGAISKAVSRWFPTETARVQEQIRSCGICGGQSGAGTGLLQVLRIPLRLIPQTVQHLSSSIIRCWYNWPNSGRRANWTQSQGLLGNKIRQFYADLAACCAVRELSYCSGAPYKWSQGHDIKIC